MTYGLCRVSVSGRRTRQVQLRCSSAHTWCLPAGREKKPRLSQPSSAAGSRLPASPRGRNGSTLRDRRCPRTPQSPEPPNPSPRLVSAVRATRCGAELSPQKDVTCLRSDRTRQLTCFLHSLNSCTGFHKQLSQLSIHQSKTTYYLGQQNPQFPSVDRERGKDFSSSIKTLFPASSLHSPAHSCALSPQPLLCSLSIFRWGHTLLPVINDSVLLLGPASKQDSTLSGSQRRHQGSRARTAIKDIKMGMGTGVAAAGDQAWLPSRDALDEAGRSLSANLCRLQPHFEERRGKVQIRQITDFHGNHRPSHA